MRRSGLCHADVPPPPFRITPGRDLAPWLCAGLVGSCPAIGGRTGEQLGFMAITQNIKESSHKSQPISLWLQSLTRSPLKKLEVIPIAPIPVGIIMIYRYIYCGIWPRPAAEWFHELSGSMVCGASYMLRYEGGARCTPDWSWLKGGLSFYLFLCFVFVFPLLFLRFSVFFSFGWFVSTIICE